MTSVMAVDSVVVLRVGDAHHRRRPPGTTSVASSGRTKLLPMTGVGAASGVGQQQQQKGNSGEGTSVPLSSSSPATSSTQVIPPPYHSTQRLHFLTHCGTFWAGCLRDQVRHCWTMFTKRKKGQSIMFFLRFFKVFQFEILRGKSFFFQISFIFLTDCPLGTCVSPPPHHVTFLFFKKF